MKNIYLTKLFTLSFLISLILFVKVSYAVIWPNTPGGGRTYPHGISSDFGPRMLRGAFDFHGGLDFPDDPNIRAVESGIVYKKGVDSKGNPYLLIKGLHTVYYTHLISNLGEAVRGQVLGDCPTTPFLVATGFMPV